MNKTLILGIVALILVALQFSSGPEIVSRIPSSTTAQTTPSSAATQNWAGTVNMTSTLSQSTTGTGEAFKDSWNYSWQGVYNIHLIIVNATSKLLAGNATGSGTGSVGTWTCVGPPGTQGCGTQPQTEICVWQGTLPFNQLNVSGTLNPNAIGPTPVVNFGNFTKFNVTPTCVGTLAHLSQLPLIPFLGIATGVNLNATSSQTYNLCIPFLYNACFSTTFTPRHGTQSKVQCNPSRVAADSSTTCTVTVTDSSTAPTVPTGTVQFFLDPSGGSGGTPAGNCDLSASGSSASCDVNYSFNSSEIGSHTILADYVPDSSHNASHGMYDITVSAPTKGASIFSTFLGYIEQGASYILGWAIRNIPFVGGAVALLGTIGVIWWRKRTLGPGG